MPPISATLPKRSDAFYSEHLFPFFSNMIPEGANRRVICRSLKIDEQDYRLAPAYDLINTSLHINGDDFGLDSSLSSDIEKSDIYDKTCHPCRLDFERFGDKIGLVKKRIDRILNKYIGFPEEAKRLVDHSFLTEKLKRNYVRIVNERISRFATGAATSTSPVDSTASNVPQQ